MPNPTDTRGWAARQCLGEPVQSEPGITTVPLPGLPHAVTLLLP